MALHDLLSDARADRFDKPTLFKSWTINDILRHLHFWNRMAMYQLTDEERLASLLKIVLSGTKTMREVETDELDGLSGAALLSAWREGVDATADVYTTSDPKQRLKWAGPSMSARSSITARLMETWAHGQAIYDDFGVERHNTDRIENIVVLGVNTFGWTYKVRGEEPPGPAPYVALAAPSGAVWTYGEENDDERIEGPAEAFCQVVTQTRNIADTPLVVKGDIALDWMSKAQCFAGGPETPPAPGVRRVSLPGDLSIETYTERVGEATEPRN